MARIRTIKPELWTDPEFTECSLSARLLFIASLNFATDFGVLPDKPKQLKMQCLPADSCDIEPLVEELIDHDFFVRTTAPNGDKVLVIRTFSKNQRINRRTEGRWGNPADWGKTHGGRSEDSVRTHGAPPPGRDNSDDPEDLEADTSDDSDSSDSPQSAEDPAPHGDSSTKKKRDRTIDLIVTLRAKGEPKRPAWRAAVRTDVEATHGPKLDDLLERFPDAPADVIAGVLETGDSRSLAYYRTPDKPEPDPGPPLTREQREALIAANKEQP